MIKFFPGAPSALALAALLGAAAFTAPAFAASTAGALPAASAPHVIVAQNNQAPPPAPSGTTPATPAPSENQPAASQGGTAQGQTVTPVETKRDKRVEARIKDLHTKLHITTAQESDWNDLAQVMRENAKEIDAVARDRAAHFKTMNAVDNLNSYQAMVQAHAEGLKRLVPVFSKLYGDLSDAQKKDADLLFRHMGTHHRAHHHHRAAPKTQ